MKLYEIRAELEALIQLDDETLVNEDTGEIYDQEAFDALKLSLEEKVDNICYAIKNNEAEKEVLQAKIDVFNKEINKLVEKQLQLEKRNEWLRGYIFRNVEHKNIKKDEYQIKFTKSEKVEIPDADLVEAEYIRTKVTNEPDKVAIKKALKEGKELTFAKLVKSEGIKVS